jgi:hypothetical protein
MSPVSPVIEPHLPVPSFNFRFRLRDGGLDGPSLASETMVQHLWNPLDQEDLEHFHVRRTGTQWFGRVNLSQRLVHRLRVHASVGVTFSEDFLVENQDRPVYRGKHLRNAVNPDASLSFDFRARPWLSLHLTGSYGTTFVYSDNQPRKSTGSGSGRCATRLQAPGCRVSASPRPRPGWSTHWTLMAPPML